MWKQKNNTLIKTVECKNFLDAVDLINNIAPIAEDMNHHPDITIRDYKFVDITLTTHDAGTVTEKDHTLAQKITDLIQTTC